MIKSMIYYNHQMKERGITMNDYNFKVWFADGFIAYYTIAASNYDMAIAMMEAYADYDAVEADTEMVDYILESVE